MSKAKEILKMLEGFRPETQFKREKKFITDLLNFSDVYEVKLIELTELTKHTMRQQTKKMYQELYDLNDDSDTILRELLKLMDDIDQSSAA